MREIGVLTTSRADFGIYQPVLEAMRRDGRLRPRLIASGSHVERRYGMTKREILDEGYAVFREARCLTGDMAESMARATAAIGRILRDWRPDVLLVLGDRFEMLAGALAAPARAVPLAHVHGGELSAGALDDCFRHALTKISHLHFPATADAAARLRRMGEEAWRITVTGAPALDRLRGFRPVDMDLPERFLLVTYHPVTTEPGREAEQAGALVEALMRSGLPSVVTAPNADPGRDAIERRLKALCKRDRRSRYLTSVGARGYFTLMTRAAAMVGNSSSGLIEAPSFRLPVVNIGSRQTGRLRAANVIDCGNGAEDIAGAIRRALRPAFRRSLASLRNPYGDGRAGDRIARRLATVDLGAGLLRKEFVDA
jgi:UDP-hydrolysing UDP-N-acetyl-D-glucosamine 2-epimerase